MLQIAETETNQIQAPRPLLRSLARGFSGRCPHCGSGRIFSFMLATNAACAACGEPLHHHRADDLPPYLNIFLTGHVVVGAMLTAMVISGWPMWAFAAATVAIATGVSVALMRPLKGAVIGAQWALRMHGFGGHED